MAELAKRARADVPMQFVLPDMLPYPSDNTPPFEDWLYKNIASGEVPGDRLYLSVCWTGYYKRYDYGKNKAAINVLQSFLNTLDKSQKYWTVVQNDDGILNDLSHIDCKVFSMSGKPIGSEPLPLVCNPHKFSFPGIKKDILCSFVGRPTNPVRNDIIGFLSGRKDYYIATHAHSMEDYCSVLARSMFVLCPPGYGANSFRVCESLQYGAAPIILQNVSDPLIFERKMPLVIYDYDQYIDSYMISSLDVYMRDQRAMKQDFWNKVVKETYEDYYTFPAVKKYILSKLAEECNP